MRIWSRVAAACAAALLSGALLGSTAAVPAAAATPAFVGNGASACHAGTPGAAPATTRYYDPAQPALGPQALPGTAPVAPLLLDYSRFGALSEHEFVSLYRDASGWIYPPDDGFLRVGGRPVRYEQELWPGEQVDRFGYPGGAYLAPAGTPFFRRALPPQSLTTPTGTPESNYHLYCVLRPFDVQAGPIAPWFAQPGLGLQFRLDARYLPAAGTGLSVTWLLANGYLTEERPG